MKRQDPEKKLTLFGSDVARFAYGMAADMRKRITHRPIRVHGVPRGGVPVELTVLGYLGDDGVSAPFPEQADAIVDDIIDSGRTASRFDQATPFYALLAKRDSGNRWLTTEAQSQKWVGQTVASDVWVVFPWEGTVVGSAEDIVVRLLQFIGEDVERGGLLETPARVVRAWQEWTSGYHQDPKDILKVFEDGAEKMDEMVVMRDIEFYSQCEHHLAPFFGTVAIGYVPNGKIVGLSKLPRLVDVFARRLQVQERMTNEIADALEEHLDPKGVAVVVTARHLCMESRGRRLEGSKTVTSAMRGVMRDKPEARAEFLSFIK